MPQAKPAVVTKTKLDNETTKDEKVIAKRTVTYVFHITSDTGVHLPYAVAVQGVVRDEYKTKPKKVSGNNGKIVVNDVAPGSQVSLFLNSDAHPSYRKNPVYSVTPADKDVIVKINEKAGRHPDTDTPVRTTDMGPTAEPAKNEDTYAAALTGDIWMKVSHLYTSQEVDDLLPSGTHAFVTTAVKKIYDVLTTASMTLTVPPQPPASNERTITITFDEGSNALANINSGYEQLSQGLTRVHPAGFAAIFNAAIDAGVTKVAMSSCWRPMLGKIPHRAGLGLDVNFVGPTRLNRQELRIPTAVDTTNVSEDEKGLFATFEARKAQQSVANKEVTIAKAEVKKAKNDPEKLAAAKQRLKSATEAYVGATQARKDAEVAWNAERDKNEPDYVRRFRASLLQCKSIQQVLDPWFMETNTRDTEPGVANMQQNQNEKTHANHLHITVNEPNIL
jgi:hypothetical protein